MRSQFDPLARWDPHEPLVCGCSQTLSENSLILSLSRKMFSTVVRCRY